MNDLSLVLGLTVGPRKESGRKERNLPREARWKLPEKGRNTFHEEHGQEEPDKNSGTEKTTCRCCGVSVSKGSFGEGHRKSKICREKARWTQPRKMHETFCEKTWLERARQEKILKRRQKDFSTKALLAGGQESARVAAKA